MNNCRVCIMIGVSAVLVQACREPQPFPDDQRDQRLSGGSTTVFDATAEAFGHPFPTLSGHDLEVHELGDRQFEQTFVASPAPVNSGLGPIYNNVSCSSCHHNDGIGIPTVGDPQSSLLIRLSLPGTDVHGGPLPAPGYGSQLQDKAIFGKSLEGNVVISYSYQKYSLADGQTYELRAPVYSLVNLYFPQGGMLISPRLAPPVFGMGLLEAIPEDEIQSHASEGVQTGIHGKPNYVWNPITQRTELGRFGRKASVASILEQVAVAYNQDIGITNKYFPTESCAGQSQFDNRADDPELPDSLLIAVKFYVQSLAVPARRNVNDPTVVGGQAPVQAGRMCELPYRSDDHRGQRRVSRHFKPDDSSLH